jgi:type I restriction enzyme S subunit
MLLKNLYEFSNGKSWNNLESGSLPIYGSTGIIGYSAKSLVSGENTLIARVGANCGYLQFVNGEYWVTDNTIVATAKDVIIPKYGFYLLSTLGIQRLKIGAAQPLLTIGILNSIETNIHSIDEQRHIVNTISFLLLKSL